MMPRIILRISSSWWISWFPWFVQLILSFFVTLVILVPCRCKTTRLLLDQEPLKLLLLCFDFCSCYSPCCTNLCIWGLSAIICFSWNIIEVPRHAQILMVVEIGHPCIDMQRENFANVNGEDIELASRELSQSQLSSRGRDDVGFLLFIFFLDRSRRSKLSTSGLDVGRKQTYTRWYLKLSFTQRLHRE